MDKQIQKRELAEQIRLLLKQVIPAQFGSAGISLVSGIAFWNSIPTNLIIGWVSAIWLLVIIRITITRHFLKCPRNDDEVLRWRPVAIMGAFASGGLYGAGAFVFMPYCDPFQLVFLTVLVAGSIASGLASQTPFPPAFTAFSIAVLVPYGAGMLMRPESALVWVSALTFVYLLTQLAHGRYLASMVSESIRLRYENAELIEELRGQTYRAEQATLSKSKFLAAASHDLRQPVHALGMFVEAQQDLELSDSAEHLRQRMAASVQALARLTDSLLDVSRIEAGTLESRPEAIALAPLFQQLAAELTPLASQKGINLRMSAGQYWVNTDQQFLERILRNLVENAIKFTDTGAVIVVCRRREAQLAIVIMDSGRGIRDEEKNRIFHEFYQGRQKQEAFSGLGLGLSIVKGLADNLNHRIEMDSEPGTGSVFRVILPRSTSPKTNDRIPSKSQPSVAELGIIVIDDDPIILESIEAVLTLWQCKVATYRSLRSCLEDTNRDWQPDLLLVDYRLEGQQTGDKVVAALRNHFKRSVKAFIITGETAAEPLRQISEANLPVLRKPVQPARLRIALNAATRPNQSSAKSAI
ncbi:MAG: hybrid sensor histidine kinase/response regulator [Pseudohongiella sp.]|uniref:ATP-binding response regulator n=1 Tax=Pseudohongiella sp. TaxID=1979412 RepID=UPI0034A04394